MNVWQILEVFLMDGLLSHSPRFSSALKILQKPECVKEKLMTASEIDSGPRLCALDRLSKAHSCFSNSSNIFFSFFIYNFPKRIVGRLLGTCKLTHWWEKWNSETWKTIPKISWLFACLGTWARVLCLPSSMGFSSCRRLAGSSLWPQISHNRQSDKVL